MSLLNSSKGQALYIEKIISIMAILIFAISSVLSVYYVVDTYRKNNENLILNSVCLSLSSLISQMNSSEISRGYAILELGDRMTFEGSDTGVFIVYRDKVLKCELGTRILGGCYDCFKIKIEKKRGETYLIS